MIFSSLIIFHGVFGPPFPYPIIYAQALGSFPNLALVSSDAVNRGV